LIPGPIRKVLSTMQTHRVRALLMGGQACVFYGAMEFSRDVDLAILDDLQNLERFQNALADLKAEQAYVPSLSADALQRGHAVHFRCQAPGVVNLRIDIMTKMRGVGPFQQLWERRTTIEDSEAGNYELLGLPDLVQAKKTQRDKDWPVVRRLLEADYASSLGKAELSRIEFWLREIRSPQLLIEVASQHPQACDRMLKSRPLLAHAAGRRAEDLALALQEEECLERERDRAYWQPLKAELEKLRHESGRKK